MVRAKTLTVRSTLINDIHNDTFMNMWPGDCIDMYWEVDNMDSELVVRRNGDLEHDIELRVNAMCWMKYKRRCGQRCYI